jgi:hypothetical protein
LLDFWLHTTIVTYTEIALLVDCAKTDMLVAVQKSIEFIPPIIVALDTATIDGAREVVEKLGHFSPADLAFIVRQGMLDTNLMRELVEDGWFVIGGTRFADAPSKVTLDVKLALRTHDESGNLRTLPHALTLEPFKTTNRDELKYAAKLVTEVHNTKTKGHDWFTPTHEPVPDVGVSLIGIAQPEVFHHSDREQIGSQACNEAIRALAVGIQAFEIVFNGLEIFIHERNNVAELLEDGPTKAALLSGEGIMLTSKLSLAEIELKKAAAIAYKLGARSIILGDSVVKNDKPSEVIQTVLDQRI